MADGHLLCFASAHCIGGALARLLGCMAFSLSLILSFRFGLLQSCDTRRFFGDGGTEVEELDMGHDMPLSSHERDLPWICGITTRRESLVVARNKLAERKPVMLPGCLEGPESDPMS